MNNSFDVVVIGSGFGGSVSALRLREKGYSVAVLEAGRRFEDKDFPKTSWRLNKFLFAPKLGLYGIQRIHVLPDVLVLSGAGVGGGSLVYANTLYQPGDDYFNDKQWASITNWKKELEPWFNQARRMLGVTENPYFSNSDQAMKDAAIEMGVGHTFQMAPLGVFFGEGKGIAAKDPFFGGVGPDRNGCLQWRAAGRAVFVGESVFTQAVGDVLWQTRLLLPSWTWRSAMILGINRWFV
jgi:cholesterol oxidase